MARSWLQMSILVVVNVILAALVAGLAMALQIDAVSAALGAVALTSLTLAARVVWRSATLARGIVELADRRREAERANQAKSRFLASMSHELRTPLNAIIGFADLMHDERLGPVSDQHRECLDDIRGSARHLLDLINEVLDLARIESGQDHASTSKRSIRCRWLSSRVDSLRPLASEGNLYLALEARPMGTVMLDPARMRQVLINYLSNAIKFTPEGGSVQTRLYRDREELVIEVNDTGPGIAPENYERVFGEFEQLQQSRHGGTGLGLAVTRRIAEALGGTVGVHSALGARKHVLRATPRHAAYRRTRTSTGRAPRPACRHPGGAMTSSSVDYILVVDDHELNLKLLQRVLELDGHTRHRGPHAARRRARDRAGGAGADRPRPQPPRRRRTRPRAQAQVRSAHGLVARSSPAPRGRCRASASGHSQAGCDAYVSKPIDTRGFAELVGSLARRPAADVQLTRPSASTNSNARRGRCGAFLCSHRSWSAPFSATYFPTISWGRIRKRSSRIARDHGLRDLVGLEHLVGEQRAPPRPGRPAPGRASACGRPAGTGTRP